MTFDADKNESDWQRECWAKENVENQDRAIREAVLAEREACAKVADADLLAVPGGRVAAEARWDNGKSERTAKRIAAAIRARTP